MNRILSVTFLLFAVAFAAASQDFAVSFPPETAAEIEEAGGEPLVDSTLVGLDVMAAIPVCVTVSQSPGVRRALAAQVEKNEGKKFVGYRIRLYRGSGQGAREASASAISRFNALYPSIPAWRTYEAPNFRVSAGNFRSRVDAEAILRDVKSEFPGAFVVREQFKYPAVGQPVRREESSELSIF